ncbi:MAG: transketolase [Elusimicrobia bacterium]|nr:transketolase [Elusimicrobiota bacterium]
MQGVVLDIAQLKVQAKKIRRDIIKMLGEAGSGHPGGSLSATDLMTGLFFNTLRHRPKEPHWPGRDRFVLSKGHCAPVLYACLAESGYFPLAQLLTLRQLGSCLQGHPSCQDVSGVEVSTGSLGMGLSVAVGLALGAKLDQKDVRVFCLVGDGELQEGQIWEATMSASHYRLDNLCCIVDNNDLQIDGRVKEVMNIYPLADKFKAFGWQAIEIEGHDLKQILAAYAAAARSKEKPTVIIARTVKGKGVSFMEDQEDWHGKAPNKELTAKALKELE